MKTIVIALIAILLPALCFGQEDKKTSPDEKISVQKDFDEDGNLIRYDSTYTFQWFSDSISNLDFMLKFHESFGNNFPFGNFPPNDSLFQGFSFPGFEHFFNGNSFFESFGFPIDSMFFDAFPFSDDFFSIFSPDSLHVMNPDFAMPDSVDFEQFFNNYVKNNPSPLLNEKQREELDALLKKQQQELDELMHKWQEINSNEKE